MKEFLINLHYNLQKYSLIRNYLKTYSPIPHEYISLATIYILTETTPEVEADLDAALGASIGTVNFEIINSEEFRSIQNIIKLINNARANAHVVSNSAQEIPIELENFVSIDNDSLIEYIIFHLLPSSSYQQQLLLRNALINLLTFYESDISIEIAISSLNEDTQELTTNILTQLQEFGNLNEILTEIQAYFHVQLMNELSFQSSEAQEDFKVSDDEEDEQTPLQPNSTGFVAHLPPQTANFSYNNSLSLSRTDEETTLPPPPLNTPTLEIQQGVFSILFGDEANFPLGKNYDFFPPGGGGEGTA